MNDEHPTHPNQASMPPFDNESTSFMNDEHPTHPNQASMPPFDNEPIKKVAFDLKMTSSLLPEKDSMKHFDDDEDEDVDLEIIPESEPIYPERMELTDYPLGQNHRNHQSTASSHYLSPVVSTSLPGTVPPKVVASAIPKVTVFIFPVPQI
eukprot:CCRYP_017966-RA/>CCRYP_017966-RA protein AED:0.43 eAED:0.43 QI:0/-1/0/1/-1/1/1/0/150